VFNLSSTVGVIVLPAAVAFLFTLAAMAVKRANQLGVEDVLVLASVLASTLRPDSVQISS